MPTNASVTLSADQAHKVISHLLGYATMLEVAGVEMMGVGEFNGAVEAQVAASDARHIARRIEQETRCHEETPDRKRSVDARPPRSRQPRMEIVK